MLLPTAHIGGIYMLHGCRVCDAVGWVVGGRASYLQEELRNLYKIYYSDRKSLKKVCILHSQVKTNTPPPKRQRRMKCWF